MKRFGRDQEGAVAISYVVTIAMIAVAMMPGLSMLQESASGHLTATSGKIKQESATMLRGPSGRNSGRLVVVMGDKSKPYERSVTRQ